MNHPHALNPPEFLAPADRASDAHRTTRQPRPGILGRRVQNTLLLIAVAFIVYGTTGPVLNALPVRIGPAAAPRWIPPLRGFDSNDFFTNLLVYVPVGVALRLVFRRRGRGPLLDFSLALGAAVALSWATEVCQQWLPGRTSSLSDIAINSLGAFAGAALAPGIQHALRTLHRHAYAAAQENRAAVLAIIAFAALFAALTAPWFPAPFHFTLDLSCTAPAAALAQFAFFAAWGFLVASALHGHGALHGRAWLRAIVLVITAAAGIEALQSVLAQHAASLAGLVMESAGGVFGAALATRRIRTPPQISTAAAAPAIGSAAIAACLVLRSVPALAFREPVIRWIPFQAEFQAPLAVAAPQALNTLLSLGVLSLLACEFGGRRSTPLVVTLVIAGTGLVELLRGTLSTHVITSTPLLLAAIASMTAANIWHSLIARAPEQSCAAAPAGTPVSAATAQHSPG